jgi:ABC-type dipeptide/oligopeptide/nickel transport system permease subunit
VHDWAGVQFVQATLSIASAVIAEASSSFLGLGQQHPHPPLEADVRQTPI